MGSPVPPFARAARPLEPFVSVVSDHADGSGGRLDRIRCLLGLFMLNGGRFCLGRHGDFFLKQLGSVL